MDLHCIVHLAGSTGRPIGQDAEDKTDCPRQNWGRDRCLGLGMDGRFQREDLGPQRYAELQLGAHRIKPFCGPLPSSTQYHSAEVLRRFAAHSSQGPL